MPREKVALSKCPQYTEEDVFRSVSEAVALLGGMESFVRPGDKVLLKPNLIAPKRPDQAVTTHPLVVKAVGRLVRECGGEITIGDSPALAPWGRLVSMTGMKYVARELGARLVRLTESVWVERGKSHRFKRLEVAKEAVESDLVINLPKLKTHTQMYLTLGVKNIFGCLVGKRKPAWHMESGSDHMAFARRITELYHAVSPGLTLVDGVVGMEGNGPGSGDPRHIGLIAAGRDAVAVDRVILDILGGREALFYTLKAAGELGIGVHCIEDIEVAGCGIEECKLTGFRFPELIGVEFAPSFLRPYIRGCITSKPMEDRSLCTLCAACIEACPPQVIQEEAKRLNFNYDECIRCYCCLEVCPEGAMKMKQGLVLKALQMTGMM